MINALEEIKYLRGMCNFEVDTQNNNRYRILVKENDGQTSYCFGLPIYNIRTRKLITPKVMRRKNGYKVEGTNCSVDIIDKRCAFKSGKDIVIFEFENQVSTSKRNEYVQVDASLNGVRFNVNSNYIRFTVDARNIAHTIRLSKSSFSLMKDQFKPYLTIAALYSMDEKINFSPLNFRYTVIEDGIYSLEIVADKTVDNIIFEANMHEEKFFQDTTVEEKYPDDNNVYAAVGFIGNTELFGRQWLYLRPSFSIVSDICTENIDKAILHIPVFYRNTENIRVATPVRRFCSFGSTWANKKDCSDEKLDIAFDNKYLSIDVSNLFIDKQEHKLLDNNGLVLKGSDVINEQIVISTGDNYSAPMILEIKTKK